MGMLEEIARGGRSTPISHYLKGKQEERAGKLADLNLQIAEKKLGKMESEEDLLTSRKKTVSEVDFDETETPYSDLAKMFAEKGDTEFATLYQGFASARQKMDAEDKKGMDDKLADFNEFYTNEAKVITSLKTPEEVTSEYANFRQKAIERFPKLSESLPENADPKMIIQEAQKQIIRATDMDIFLGGKEGKAQSLQILEPGETIPRAGTFKDGKYFIRDDTGVEREADPASQIFGKSKITGKREDVISGKDRSKELVKFKDYGIAQKKVVSAIDTLTKELGVNKDGTLLGALGGAATTIESIAQQVRTVQKKLGGKQASSNANDYDISGLTGLAIETSRAKSMIIDLAFSIATAREGGKLTDRDIKAALETIGANSGSIPQMVAALGVKRSQITREYGIEHKSRMGADTPEGFFPSKKSLDALTPDEMSGLSDEEFDAMLKRQQ